ncbi:hypothetical protein, partial [Stutzerimonas nitrititolerans]|uniref:hypothetical protein n=1 Tax=Stutzerimonas nitrititolerans TaxID=2482751 RepID=UPI0028ACD38D
MAVPGWGWPHRGCRQIKSVEGSHNRLSIASHARLRAGLITLRPRAIEKSAGKLEAEREKPNLRTCRAFVQLSSLPRFYRGTSADRVSPQIQPIDLSLFSVTSARPHMQLVDIGVNL